eukprot:gnl/Ergobibamus_cyprinoides/45.p1 GENE.gnl/Ergobibamus_cyprinoides/45~~gnl/Ergobibamus_cyprinoides/45.p1  ORF type:complete len:516 (+),score=158.09 gnl/Ergobibamus_cyprinoides/45:168-1550(+)
MPLDVADTNDLLDMDLLWQIASYGIVLLAVLVIPFCMMFYESKDEEYGVVKQFFHAFWACLAILVFVAVAVVICYSFGGTARIPVVAISSPLTANGADRLGPVSTVAYSSSATTMDISVTLAVYVIAVFVFVGYVLFTIFGAIGLVALPLDGINAWRTRPHPMSDVEFAQWQLVFRDRAQRLLHVCDAFERESARRRTKAQELSAQGERDAQKKLKKLYTGTERKLFNQIRQAVVLLERDFDFVLTSRGEREYNPFVYWGKLLGGIVGAVISFAWVAHMAIYMFSDNPMSTVLNALLDWLGTSSATAVVVYSGLVVYLQLAVLKGNVKFGMRFFLLMAIHPMEAHKTMMSSFLFNMILLLLSTVAVVKFCTTAFSVYALDTSAQVIFGLAINYLSGMSSYFTYAPYVMLVILLITLVYLLAFPAEKPQEVSLESSLHASGLITERVGDGKVRETPRRAVK